MNIRKFKAEPVRITFLMEKIMRKQYKKYCLTNDIVMSDRIRLVKVGLLGIKPRVSTTQFIY